MATYDKYYKEKKYFGNPYPQVMTFFETHTPKGSLCDLDAGQGRDSIPFQKMGYSVTAVDISNVGLEGIKQECPEITTVLHDVYTFSTVAFPIVFMNSMLHFFKNDVEKEEKLIGKIVSEMSAGDLFANCIIENRKNQMEQAMLRYNQEVVLIHEEIAVNTEANATFYFSVYQKK